MSKFESSMDLNPHQPQKKSSPTDIIAIALCNSIYPITSKNEDKYLIKNKKFRWSSGSLVQ